MANPIADPNITQWQSDLATSDSNRPITSTDYMSQGSPEDLAANQRVWRATFRSEGVNKQWERWLNLNSPQSPNPAPPVYAAVNEFTLTGDWTTIAVVGRRIKASVAAGTVYATITSSVFAGATTTVLCQMDAGQQLDAGLTEIQFGVPKPSSQSDSSLPGDTETQSRTPTFTTITNGGAGTAFTGILTPAIAAYKAGKLYYFLWTQASQGGDTIALNGLAAVPVKKWAAGVLVALIAGDVPAGAIGVFLYDGTNFDLQTVFSTSIPNGYITTAMIAANAVTNFAKATLGVSVTVGAGGTTGYNTWLTILSASLTVADPAHLTEIFATLSGVITKMGNTDEFDFRITDQAGNTLTDPDPNINQIATVSSLAFGGLQIGAPLTPGAAGANTFNFQIKLVNGSANALFAVTINTLRLWVKEAIR